MCPVFYIEFQETYCLSHKAILCILCLYLGILKLCKRKSINENFVKVGNINLPVSWEDKSREYQFTCKILRQMTVLPEAQEQLL